MSNKAIPLKDQNRSTLLAVLIANLLIWPIWIRWSAIEPLIGGPETTRLISPLVLPLTLGFLALLTSSASADTKAKLLFFRRDHPMPSTRVFSIHGPKDNDVDMEVIAKRYGPLPTSPKKQQALWYQLYGPLQDKPQIIVSHRNYLLFRDWAWLSFLTLCIFGLVGTRFIDDIHTACEIAVPVYLQWLIVSIAARTAAFRMTTRVLALAQSGEPIKLDETNNG